MSVRECVSVCVCVCVCDCVCMASGDVALQFATNITVTQANNYSHVVYFWLKFARGTPASFSCTQK